MGREAWVGAIGEPSLWRGLGLQERHLGEVKRQTWELWISGMPRIVWVVPQGDNFSQRAEGRKSPQAAGAGGELFGHLVNQQFPLLNKCP